ncbi:MAG: glycosyltransferase family 2 protein [Candidatus Spechtbacteria bacterium]|nr:glycosyltransferase family 2 protein [Candidatus Spechtbacteria bacterium]
MEKPWVGIVTINWNNPQETLECLKSLSGVSYDRKRIFVVDNGSSDDSVEVLSAQQQALNFTFVESKENTGFSGGCNIGMRKALEDNDISYILFLNNDTTVAPDFLDKMIEVAEGDKAGGMWAPVIYYSARPDEIWFAGGKLRWMRVSQIGEHVIRFATRSSVFAKQSFRPTRGEIPFIYNANKSDYFETEFITGCAMLARRKVAQRVGEWDERFFLYFEDVDYSLRAKDLGWKLHIIPSAKIWHKVSATALGKVGSPKILYYHHRNGMLITKLHGPFWANVYKHYWAAAKVKLQLLKILLGINREQSRAIIRGITDYYKGNWGKID